MIKLLRSNLLRLVKSKSFYVALAIQALLVLAETINYHLVNLNPDVSVSADIVFIFIACNPFSAVLLAVVCSLFTGSDYHNGTIRNKLIIGYPRYYIYIANLITSMLIAVCINFSAFIVFLPVSLPLLGGMVGEPVQLLTMFLLSNLIALVYASIYNTVAMTSKSTVASLIITIGSLLFFMIIAQYFISEINAPLTYTEIIMNEAGETVTKEVPNTFRKSEGVLRCFTVLLNIFPSGQMSILNSELCEVWQIVVSSVCLLGVSTGAGIAVFNRENLK